MLSLLLGLVQARTKHVARKHVETQSSEYKIPESLLPYVSKDPRYIKVYRPKESATATTNGGGVNKCYVSFPLIYVYLNDDASRNLAAGCSIGAIGCGFIPEAIVSKILAAVCGISAIAINNANRGRGIIIKLIAITGGFAGLSSQ